MDTATLIKLICDIITAVAKLLWPIITIIIIIIFKREISSLLVRVRRGKLFGQELEMEPIIDKFNKSVEEAKQEIVLLEDTPEKMEQDFEVFDRDAKEILDISAKDPSLGIVKLSIDIEKEVRRLAASLGYMRENRQNRGIIPLFMLLLERGFFPKHTGESLRTFWNLRNKVVHGKKDNLNAEEVISILDNGLSLLRIIRSIPHETNVVDNIDIDLFSDENCTHKISDAKGLILSAKSPGRVKISKRIFPTTKLGYYRKGKRVAWDWNLSLVWGPTWYINPDTGEKMMAWSSAGEFVGRHIDDL